MTPKEKASFLKNKFLKYTLIDKENTDVFLERRMKKCALICTKEILTELNKLPSSDLSDLQYWTEVESYLQ